jgi:predicted DCC family thiol-disulfide oxidoreductase YuxK
MDQHILILYDGVCGLCNAFVNFLLRHDDQDRFRFAALQSELGREVVERNGGDPNEVSTVYFVEGVGSDAEAVRTRGKAALYAVDQLGGAWRILALLRFLPAFLLNIGYRLVARFRYRLFGKLDACPVPDPEVRAKFLG